MDLIQSMHQEIARFSSAGDTSIKHVKEFLHNFYDLFDTYQSELLESGKYIVDCKAGCSECCNHWVEDVYGFEADLILHTIKKNFTGSCGGIRKEAQDAVTLFETIYEDAPDSDEITLLNDFYSKKKQCPLLDKNGLCMIYSIRPLTCRGFFSEDFKRYCTTYSGQSDKSGTYMLLPPEDIESQLDDLHLKYYKGFPTSLRLILSFIT